MSNEGKLSPDFRHSCVTDRDIYADMSHGGNGKEMEHDTLS